MTLQVGFFVILSRMVHEFIIFHWDKSKASMPSVRSMEGAYRFETCLRGIVISTSGFPLEFSNPPTEVLQGDNAYSWLLEVLAGLHSPLLGETEVLGQFREQVLFPLGNSIPSFLKGIVEDVKKVRHECLQNLGQKTYGSLARRLMIGDHPLYFLGAGQMTREILPFMQKMNRKKVTVVARSVERAKRTLPLACELQTWDVQVNDPVFDLIVAAPVSDEGLRRWIQKQSGLINRCLDLRALPVQPERNEWSTREGFWNLEDFFSMQKGEEAVAREKVVLARRRIQQVTEKRWTQRWDRPFGWEDVCA
jgi:glutamyl-tRNA reductase